MPDDRATITEANRWLRQFALDALHYGMVDAVGYDRLQDLTLRFEELTERVCVTGVLQGQEEDDLERGRR